MPAAVINNIYTGSIEIDECQFHDELLTFAGAATRLRGTLLARDTSTLNLVPYVKGGSDAGNGIVAAVLTYDVAAAGAGDIKVRALIEGKVKLERLIIAADGTGANIDGTVRDLLRKASITPVSVKQLDVLDNQ